MEKEVKIKMRVTKTITLSVYSKTRNLWGRCLLFRANDTSEVRQIIPLNNWNVNFKETEMPPKWGLHSFQHGSTHCDVQSWQQHLHHLTTSAIDTPVTSAGYVQKRYQQSSLVLPHMLTLLLSHWSKPPTFSIRYFRKRIEASHAERPEGKSGVADCICHCLQVRV